ncbi:MAG: hypothetical protein NVSMB22_00650 [Chloroflexota bacterium]
MSVDWDAGRSIPVHSRGFEHRTLKSAQRGAKLFVGSAIDAATHRSQECVKSEGYHAIAGGSDLMVATECLDIHVLVERSWEPITRTRQHSPSSASLGLIRDPQLVRRVAKTKDRQRLKRAVQNDPPCHGPPPSKPTHAVAGPSVPVCSRRTDRRTNDKHRRRPA